VVRCKDPPLDPGGRTLMVIMIVMCVIVRGVVRVNIGHSQIALLGNCCN